jgi:hypothetical protein
MTTMTPTAADNNSNDNSTKVDTYLNSPKKVRESGNRWYFNGLGTDEKTLQEYRRNAEGSKNYVFIDEQKDFKEQEKEYESMVTGYKYSSLSNIIPGTIIEEGKRKKKKRIKSYKYTIAKAFNDLSDTYSFHQLIQESEELKAEQDKNDPQIEQNNYHQFVKKTEQQQQQQQQKQQVKKKSKKQYASEEEEIEAILKAASE